MAANFNQTNKNGTRYFFATTEEGEQDLFLSTITAGALTDFYVGITGSGGNLVQINQMPDVIGTVTAGGEEMLYAGTASTYKTLSSLSGTAVGTSISIDRAPGSGITTIEAYAGNGSTGGYEFLSRGVNSALVSTNNVDTNDVLTAIGRPGATAALGASGTFITATHQGAVFNNVQSVAPSGAGCYNISDMSGGSDIKGRWSMGKFGATSGGNSGSDLAFFAYQDDGTFLGNHLSIKRSDGATTIQNISSMQTLIRTGVYGAVFPANTTNEEFGAEGKNEVIAGATSNQALYGSVWAPLFSTPLTGLNPVGKTFLSINWANSLSTGSNHVNYKVAFSTATAYTNTLTTSYVPGGQFTPSDLPGVTTPVGYTLVTACLDPDGVAVDGTGFLYVEGQISDPSAAADQLFIAKGEASEATRNALTWHIM